MLAVSQRGPWLSLFSDPSPIHTTATYTPLCRLGGCRAYKSNQSLETFDPNQMAALSRLRVSSELDPPPPPWA